MASPAYFALVLHAHLPFVRHPEHDDALEERWLYEAISETYLPLLSLLDDWRRDGVAFRLTLSLSPTLATMLADPLLGERYAAHLERVGELAAREAVRTAPLAEFRAAAEHYARRYPRLLVRWNALPPGGLAQAFARHAADGRLELITSTATHAFLPLMQHQPTAVQAQLRVGLATFRRLAGRPAAGLWNAECGYSPGLDAHFGAAGVPYFFVDTHAFTSRGAQRPRRGVYAPVATPSGPVAFARDPQTSHEIWSAWLGYPGDPVYREFYRDIGYDLELDYVRSCIHASGMRVDTGIKYHRVTGPDVELHEKQPWDPDAAFARAAEHAADFIAKRHAQAAGLAPRMDRPPLIVSPFDAELFGHWWYEGPWFLDALMRGLCGPRTGVIPVTPTQYLRTHGPAETFQPAYSSWGAGGYAGVWLNERTEWLHRSLHAAAERMTRLARALPDPAPLARRALNQAARELLLAQSSDWSFIIHMQTAADYAEARARVHLERFNALCDSLERDAPDETFVSDLESRDNVFPDLDFAVYGEKPMEILNPEKT